ncbi:MAG: T9SS type A sorting domain-containing protein [Saprospiraceae bacterium]|nr:T9SS type A sorting domain-containing protein [Saprospiraceae bacterium]
MSRISKPILTIFIFFGFIATIFSQDDECINFSDNIEHGTYGIASGFMPGNVLFMDDGVTIRLKSFQYFNGTTDFINATVSDDPIFNGDTSGLIQGDYIFPSNINLYFDFTQLPHPTTEVCFNFIDGGGEENIAVNGQNIQVLNNLTGLDGEEIAPGVIASLTLSDAFDFPAGTLCLKGNIKTLLIGGQEFVMDNVCFKTQNDDHDDCNNIRDLEAWALDCDSDSTFKLKLRFFSNLPETDSFLVRFRGDTLGYFKISQLPIIFEGLPTDSVAHLDSIEVCIQNDSSGFNCCEKIAFMQPSCPDDNEICRIKNFRVKPKPCTPNNIFFASIEFEIQGAGTAYFVDVNGETFGPYAYVGMPFPELGPFEGDGTIYEFTIRDQSNPDCKAFAKIGPIHCGADCPLTDLRLEINRCHDGNEDDEDDNNGGGDDDDDDYCLWLDLDYTENTWVSFDVYVNGNRIGTLSCDDLPIKLRFDEDDIEEYAGQEVTIKICANNFSDCCISKIIRIPDDDDDDDDECELSNGRINGLECIADNKYRVTINFDHNDTGERFRIKTLGGFEETYSYDDLPIRIALPRTEDGYDWIKIYDKENPECFTKIELELPCESESNCEIANGRIEGLECIDGNKYRVTINFDHDNTSETFKLKTSGGFQETYRYSQLPLRIPLPRPENGRDQIYILDSRNPNCYTKIEFELPCSNDDDTCSLSNIRLNDLECISDDKYRVTIDFDHGNTGDFFRLKTRGGFEGAFSYNQLPLRIALPRTEEGLDEIKICDKQNDDCCTAIEFELPCAGNGNGDCRIGGLSVQPVDCDSNKFSLKISFQATQTSSLGYFIFVDGQIFGPFNFSETSRKVGPFFASEGAVYDILILDIANPSCYGYTEISGIECNDDDDSCNDMTDLKVDVGDCSSDSTFNLLLNFDYQGVSDSFLVSFRGDTIGYFAIDSLPISLENLRSTDEQHSESLKVCLQDANDCCHEIFFTIPNCSTFEDTCRIYDLNAEALECDSTGRFKVKLTFKSENGGSEGFKIFGNGQVYGEFSYEEDSIILGAFRGDSASVYEFIFQDLEHPDCKNEITIGPIACTVQVWPGDANANNRADHFDVLHLGIGFGKQGPARSVPGNQWQGLEALSWELNFPDGVNYANADSNGDGVINAQDKQAIELNYGRTNGPVLPVATLPGDDLDPPIFVDLPDNSGLPEGLPFTVPVVLGSDDNFVEDIYGLAFTIEFDPTIINPASIEVSYLKSWLGEENVNLITFDRVEQDSGRIHIAISRTNHTSVSGFGAIALISGIIDDIAGRVTSQVEIKKVQAIKVNQEQIPLRTPAQSFQLKSNRETDSRLDIRLGMRIIPNPAVSEVQVYNRYNVPIHSLQLLDASGRPLSAVARNTDRISLEGLPQGVYMLRIEIGEFIIYERIVKM